MAKEKRRRLANHPSANPARSPARVVIGLIGVAALLGVAILVALWLPPKPEPPAVSRPAPTVAAYGQPGAVVPAYVKSAACAECHPTQHQQWAGSHHDQAMQPATAETVRGSFNDVRVSHRGVISRFFKRDGRFFVNTEGPDGKTADFEVRYTFGVAPLQQYLVEFPGGRLQGLTIAWDTGKKRWFPLYPTERFAPDDPLHWTGRYQNWNAMCADCHSTDLKKNYDLAGDTYRTAWSEINVGCEACHGPGEAHVAWARAAKGKAAKPGADGLVVRLKTADARAEVDMCAACHARRTRLGVEDRPGQPFLDRFRPDLLRAGRYHADGQQLDEVYVYGSFLQSKMYQRGVRCSDCHEPHSLKLRAEGNAICTRCHQTQPDARFPTLTAKAYDTPAHHFHKAGSPGARCVNCHMPAKTYMIVQPRPDHSLRVPRPDLSVRLGTPNACTQCHSDRSPQWAADAVAKRYGPNRRQEPHFGEVFIAARAGKRDAEPKLVALAGDRSQPVIVRASALDLLRGYGASGLAALVAATRDEDPLVRLAAVAGLDRAQPQEHTLHAAPLLRDPVRAVRIEAARVLAGVPTDRLDVSQRQALEAALAEFKEAQLATADLPASHLNMAVLHERLGRPDLAEQAYGTALRMDPYFVPARLNLVTLYNATGRNAEAERVLREGIKRTPGEGELYYSLGLLLAEEKRLPEATEMLGKAAQLVPGRARVRYNYGLALQQLGRPREAEAALGRALELDPVDPEIVYAVATLLAQQKQWKRALPYAEKLVELTPGQPGPRQLVENIRRQLDAVPGPR
jgi:predicted CXXCH cytochrome family protein